VHLNGRRVRKCSLIVNSGDRIEVHIDGLPLTPYSLAADDIVYEDKFILVVQKPAGVDSQPTPSRYKGTLYSALSEYLKNPLRKDLRPTIGMVQRLDRDTSGLIIFSIHQAAHKELTRAFQERDVTKKYQAFVAGRLLEEKGEFRSLLAKRRATNIMKSVARGGQEAITRFQLLAANDELSYVEIEIPTGRSHQIRAHFSEAGHPLLGDVRYGGPKTIGEMTFERQMLHARQLLLKHPKSGERLDFQSELPYDMQRVKTHFFNGY
jgi:23S rRNA pseudouridine1911/1915/1917 synthase